MTSHDQYRNDHFNVMLSRQLSTEYLLNELNNRYLNNNQIDMFSSNRFSSFVLPPTFHTEQYCKSIEMLSNKTPIEKTCKLKMNSPSFLNSTKNKKWCTAHIRICWMIYHQQKQNYFKDNASIVNNNKSIISSSSNESSSRYVSQYSTSGNSFSLQPISSLNKEIHLKQGVKRSSSNIDDNQAVYNNINSSIPWHHSLNNKKLRFEPSNIQMNNIYPLLNSVYSIPSSDTSSIARSFTEYQRYFRSLYLPQSQSLTPLTKKIRYDVERQFIDPLLISNGQNK